MYLILSKHPQGKTSRWAVAWSFTVDPNTANIPLRSHIAGPSTAAAATGPAAADRPAALRAEPAVAAAAPAAAAAASAAVAPPRRAVRSTSFALAAQPADGRRMLQAVAALLGREGAVCKVDAAAWTVLATLPLQTAGADADTNSSEPPTKRPKTRDDRIGKGDGGGGLNVRALLSQQARGSFTVAASIPNDSSDLAARRFTDVMHNLKEDLGLMWELKGQ